MPILAKQNEYVIPLTFKCNWNCDYCAINNTYDYRDNVTHEEILKKISIIPKQSLVTLTGGEPGLIDKNNLI
jgi:organic radical activating enzyme